MVQNAARFRPSKGTRGRGEYEEYHPYGTCAWWAGDSEVVSQRRYRYTGMERDEETGLQVHGVRYYAAWLGRWGSADPIGLGDGGNRFAYSRASPVGLSDESGTQSVEEGAGVAVDGTHSPIISPTTSAEQRLWHDPEFFERITTEGARLLRRDREAVADMPTYFTNETLSDVALGAQEESLSPPTGNLFGMGRQSTEYRKFVRDTLTELKRKIVEVSSDPSHQFALQADQLLSHFDLDAVESGLTRVYIVDTRTQEGKDAVRFTGKVKEATFLPQPVTLADKLLEGIRLPSTAASGSNPGGDGLVVVVDLGQVAELNTAINSPSAPSNLLEALGAPGMSARLSLAGNLAHEIPGHGFAKQLNIPDYKQEEAVVNAWLWATLGF